MKFRIMNQYYRLSEIFLLRKSVFNSLKAKKIVNYIKTIVAQKQHKLDFNSLPVTLMVEPSSFCDMSCPMCPVILHGTKRDKGNLEFEGFKKVIDEVGDRLLFLMLWNFGEPLLNKDVFSIIRYAKNKNIFVATSTNALSLDKGKQRDAVLSGLDYVIVSFDGATPETYEKFRGKNNFDKVINNIKGLVTEKNNLRSAAPFINLQFIVMRENEHEIPKMKQLAKELKVNKLSIKKFTYVAPFDPKSSSFLPETKDYILGKYKGAFKMKFCSRPWQSAIILWNGDVVPCCGDLDFKYVFGNIYKNSFNEIWHSDKYRKFRQQIINDITQIGICRTCPGEDFTTDMFVE